MKDSINLDTLKIVNIIFAEHSKLSIENPLLKQKILALEELNKSNEITDSLRKNEISLYKDKANSDAIKIKKLENFKKKSIKGFTVGGIVLFILGLII